MYISNSFILPEQDYDHLKIVRKIRQKEESSYNNIGKDYISNRFSSPAYIKQLCLGLKTNYKQEAVYKRISQGTGLNALKNAIMYITHQTEKHKEKNIPFTDLYDHTGKKLSQDEIKTTFKEWEEDFPSKKFERKNPERYLTLRKFHEEVQILEIKEQSGSITQNEIDCLTSIRTGHVRKKIWERGTTVKLEDHSKAIIHRVDGQGKLVLRLDESASQKYKTVLKSETKPFLTKEQWGIVPYKIQDHNKQALDDINFMVESPSSSQAQKYLPKDFEHIVLSVGGDRPDKHDAFKATQEHLRDNLNLRGFKCLFAMHEENKNLHFHVIVHRRNFIDHKIKYPTGLHDNFILRSEYAEKLNEHGVVQTATIAKDRPNFLEKQREKSEKMLQSSKRFRSQKKNPEATKLFSDYYTLNEKINGVETKLKALRESKKITAKEKAEIQHVLEISRVSLKLDNEETFDMNVSAFDRSLRSKSEYMANYWSKEISSNSLKAQSQIVHESGWEKKIEAQKQITQNFLKSYKGIYMVKEDFKKEHQPIEKIQKLENLLDDTASLIIYSDALYSVAKNHKSKLSNKEDIQKILNIEAIHDKKEKSSNKSSEFIKL
jgi:hypothetical protein